jgi:NAD(P)H-flavin reductase
MRAMTMHLFTTKRHGTPAAVTEVLQQQQQSQSSQGVADLVMQTGRIQQEHFQAALQQLQAGQAGQVSAYVCGPPVMTDQVGGLVVLPALSRQEATNQQQKQHLQASGMRVSVQLAVVHVSCVGGVQLCDAKMQQQGAVLLIDDAGASNPGSAGGAAKLPAC